MQWSTKVANELQWSPKVTVMNTRKVTAMNTMKV